MPYNAVFDANQFEPNQGFGKHPVGNKFDFEITKTEVKPTAAGDGGLFEVEFTTSSGVITHRYNLFNKSAKAVEIAHGQFSALCRAVGRYQVDFNNDGAVLRGARGKLDVGYQKGEEPTAEKPDGGYVEVKRVYDVHGNEPGKAAPQQAQPQQAQPNALPNAFQNQPQSQPMTQQPGGGWGQPQAQPNQPQPNGHANGSGAWQPGQNGQAAASPPWGQR